MRSGDDRQVCHRLLQRLAFSETRHNRDMFPANTMAYDKGWWGEVTGLRVGIESRRFVRTAHLHGRLDGYEGVNGRESHGRGRARRNTPLCGCIVIRVEQGLGPLFWNLGPEYQREVRDGQPHFMTGTPEEPFLRRQAKAKDPLKHELMREKVVQVRRRGYIKPGEVTSGTHTSVLTREKPTYEWCTMAPVVGSTRTCTHHIMGC